MAVRPEDSDEEVGAAVSLGIEGEKIKAEKEQKVQKLTDPRRPTQAEVDDHNRTHLPYRNWCPHCVQGKGKDLDHRKSAEEERGLNEFSFDYCFPGDEFGCKLTVFFLHFFLFLFFIHFSVFS